MPFSIQDFGDLTRLLGEQPEWRAQLRAQILGEELLGLPGIVRQLADAQARTEQRLQQLAEAQARTEQRLEQLAEAQARTEQRLQQLVDQMTALAGNVDALRTETTVLAGDIHRLVDKVADFRGDYLEWRYYLHRGAFFSPFARRIRLVDFSHLADELEDAVAAGTIRPRERAAVLDTDLVLSGRRREDQAAVYILVEVSAGIGAHDVYRAAERAAVLAKLGRPVIAAVAGEQIDRLGKEAAAAEGVWQVLDGRILSPTGSDEPPP